MNIWKAMFFNRTRRLYASTKKSAKIVASQRKGILLRDNCIMSARFMILKETANHFVLWFLGQSMVAKKVLSL